MTFDYSRLYLYFNNALTIDIDNLVDILFKFSFINWIYVDILMDKYVHKASCCHLPFI